MSIALLSVTDKTGIEPFAEILDSHDWDLVSSGGTADAIRSVRLEVTDTGTYTGFPPIMDNRVVTLHPKIEGGILADRDIEKHLQEARDHNIDLIGLVVCNFYDFKKEPSIKKIDIGGPTMVRAAAKNWAHVGVVVDPADYVRVGVALGQNNGTLPLELRKELAAKAFKYTAEYEADIAAWFAAGCPKAA